MTDRPDMITELVVDAERRWDASCAMLTALQELRSAAIQFRKAAYDAEPTLRVSNEAVNRLSACLFAAERAVAQAEAAGIKS